jgi:hypothetical protein
MTVIEGIIREDGSLELPEKLSLPAGRVQVTLVPIPELPKNDPFWAMIQDIWDGQKARGHVPRSAAEVEAERQNFREEWEDRMQRIQQLQEEACRLQENPS